MTEGPATDAPHAGHSAAGSVSAETFVATACRPAIVRRALIMSAIVGTLLLAINHGDAILGQRMTTDRWWRSGLTYLVPYVVSTLSSVLAVRGTDNSNRERP